MICTGPVWSLCLLRHAQRAQCSLAQSEPLFALVDSCVDTHGGWEWIGSLCDGSKSAFVGESERASSALVQLRLRSGAAGLLSLRTKPLTRPSCSWKPAVKQKHACLLKQHCCEVLTEYKPVAIKKKCSYCIGTNPPCLLAATDKWHVRAHSDYSYLSQFPFTAHTQLKHRIYIKLLYLYRFKWSK